MAELSKTRHIFPLLIIPDKVIYLSEPEAEQVENVRLSVQPQAPLFNSAEDHKPLQKGDIVYVLAQYYDNLKVNREIYII